MLIQHLSCYSSSLTLSFTVSVTGLPENIGMETDAFFKSLDYNIRWPDGSDVDRKQAFLNLLNPADKIDFNYANSEYWVGRDETRFYCI